MKKDKGLKNVTYKEARTYLTEAAKRGSILGLETIENLLEVLGNPQNALRFIHIAGTNGKGSVLAYTASILTEARYRTGCYISPTVMGYLERIQVDGEWVKEEEFAGLTETISHACDTLEREGKPLPTVFELETAMAFLYFARKRCDLVVLETGLGGTQDATNIVRNTLVAAITSIGRDHMGFLGDTLEEIAKNKAGIIKPGCEVVSARQKTEVLEVLKGCCCAAGCRLNVAKEEYAEILWESWQGQRFRYAIADQERESCEDGGEYTIPLAGKHQVKNAIVSYEIIRALRRAGYAVPEKAVRNGLKHTHWPGRFECVREQPIVIVDGAHNEDAALALRTSIEQYFPGKRLFLIMGVFKDKEYRKICRIMAPLAHRIYTVNLPEDKRVLAGGTLDAESLQKEVRLFCQHTEAAGDISLAVKKSLADAGREDVILAFGSLSYLGQVIREIKSIGE